MHGIERIKLINLFFISFHYLFALFVVYILLLNYIPSLFLVVPVYSTNFYVSLVSFSFYISEYM